MNPWQIASASESSQQIALFCWAAKAEKLGFDAANDPASYKGEGRGDAIPELAFLHHIPNGGSRGDNAKSRAIAGGQLKAEGVKSGVLDVFWPLSRQYQTNRPDGNLDLWTRNGLYIEMKKPSLRNTKNPQAGCSPEQIAFGDFAHSQGYYVVVCYDWLEAAKVLQDYYEGKL